MMEELKIKNYKNQKWQIKTFLKKMKKNEMWFILESFSKEYGMSFEDAVLNGYSVYYAEWSNNYRAIAEITAFESFYIFYEEDTIPQRRGSGRSFTIETKEI
jgi:hypothetical protein